MSMNGELLRLPAQALEPLLADPDRVMEFTAMGSMDAAHLLDEAFEGCLPWPLRFLFPGFLRRFLLRRLLPTPAELPESDGEFQKE